MIPCALRVFAPGSLGRYVYRGPRALSGGCAHGAAQSERLGRRLGCPARAPPRRSRSAPASCRRGTAAACAPGTLARCHRVAPATTARIVTIIVPTDGIGHVRCEQGTCSYRRNRSANSPRQATYSIGSPGTSARLTRHIGNFTVPLINRTTTDQPHDKHIKGFKGHAVCQRVKISVAESLRAPRRGVCLRSRRKRSQPPA